MFSALLCLFSLLGCGSDGLPQEGDPLFEAIETGDLVTAKELVRNGRYSDVQDPEVRELVEALEDSDILRCMRILDIPIPEFDRSPPAKNSWMLAVEQRDLVRIKELLALGEDPNQSASPGYAFRYSALYSLATSSRSDHDLEITKVLLDAGADPNLRSRIEMGHSPIERAAFSYKHSVESGIASHNIARDRLLLMLEYDIKPQRLDYDGYLLLEFVVQSRDLELVRRVLRIEFPLGPLNAILNKLEKREFHHSADDFLIEQITVLVKNRISRLREGAGHNDTIPTIQP